MKKTPQPYSDIYAFEIAERISKANELGLSVEVLEERLAKAITSMETETSRFLDESFKVSESAKLNFVEHKKQVIADFSTRTGVYKFTKIAYVKANSGWNKGTVTGFTVNDSGVESLTIQLTSGHYTDLMAKDFNSIKIVTQ